MKNKNRIIPQMFDIKPVDEAGNLDISQIGKKTKRDISDIGSDLRTEQFRLVKEKPQIESIARRNNYVSQPKIKTSFQNFKPKIKTYQSRNTFGSEDSLDINRFKNSHFEHRKPEVVRDELVEIFNPSVNLKKEKPLKFKKDIKQLNISFLNSVRPFASFAIASVIICFLVSSAVLLGKGLKVKEAVMENGQKAYANLAFAKDGILEKNYQKSSFEFQEAQKKFQEIYKDIDSLGQILVQSGRFIPFLSKLSSGNYLAKAGENISQIGILLSETADSLNEIKNPLEAGESVSLLKVFQDTDSNLRKISKLLNELENNLSKVNLDDIPEEQRSTFIALKEKLPEINLFIDGFLADSHIFSDILGGNGPRKYLFLFQNNHEMRATGGFIGSYGIMDIFNGRIKNFMIDGIFNPDGQLREKIVPPAPIQKISATWSLHDSNWFPDFPKSAEKAAWFYEKTGGPTVDGIITMTPQVMQDLLEVTGPIEMPEYSVTIDKNNFMTEVQKEVEIDYDKELNQPKKILADLAPKILDRLFNAKDFSDLAKMASVLSQSLNEKQILIYSTNYEIQKKISEKGWSGEILNTEKDYLSVINSNINGYKTDGVIDETIEHQSEIQSDGSIKDIVTITRKHKGGDSNLEWFNKVNSDYMRVYVPRGSKLLSAKGYTREFNSAPLDYDALGFRRDSQVMMEEQAVSIDEETGTRIYEDSGKTVFANWVYVSPKETVTVEYEYLLPFRITMPSKEENISTFSLLTQKQSGSLGSIFSSKIVFPKNLKIMWKYPNEKEMTSENTLENSKEINFKTDLKQDKFIGIAFQRE